jgi:hypothetical protein
MQKAESRRQKAGKGKRQAMDLHGSGQIEKKAQVKACGY